MATKASKDTGDTADASSTETTGETAVSGDVNINTGDSFTRNVEIDWSPWLNRE